MAEKPDAPAPFSLKRWSQRKLEATRTEESPAPAEPTVPAVAPAAALADPAAAASPPLPPIESLTPESDFSVFMQPRVDESLKRAALKKLFSDPRFNVMDGLDTYIDDYSKPDPISPEMLERIAHVKWKPDPEPAPETTPASAAVAPVDAPTAAVRETPPAQDPLPVAPETVPVPALPADASKTR